MMQNLPVSKIMAFLLVCFVFTSCFNNKKAVDSTKVENQSVEVVEDTGTEVLVDEITFGRESMDSPTPPPPPPPPPPSAYSNETTISSAKTSASHIPPRGRAEERGPAGPQGAPRAGRPAPKAMKNAASPRYGSEEIMNEVIVAEMVVSGTKASRKLRKKEKFQRNLPMDDADMDFEESREPTSEQPPVKAKLLTAGEVNDFSKWILWNDIADGSLAEYQRRWQISPKERYTVQLSNEGGYPIVDAEVHLLDNDDVVWSSRSDNTGKAELWLNLYGNTNDANNSNYSESDLRIQVNYKGKTEILKEITAFHNGINHIEIDADCDYAKKTDIMFVVDATGSMGDEINYLQVELLDIMNQVQAAQNDMEFRLGSVFYRDKGTREEYLTRQTDLSKNFKKTVDFISKQGAKGGGDKPEAVESALKVAIDSTNWSEDATARLLFLILDAPPHDYPETIEELKYLNKMAAKKGIRIIPVTASGIDKSAEYLMRALALSTNGTYTFLTDDSGIGGAHIKPTTDEFKVEFFNELLMRLIWQYTQAPECKKVSKTDDALADNQPIEDTTDWLKCYPNPSTGLVNVKLKKAVDELFVSDANGKILARYEDWGTGKHEIDLIQFPTGMYVLSTILNNKRIMQKIMIVH